MNYVWEPKRQAIGGLSHWAYSNQVLLKLWGKESECGRGDLTTYWFQSFVSSCFRASLSPQIPIVGHNLVAD